MTSKSKKVRLDKMMVGKALTSSRERARALIMAGKVCVDDVMRDKPGALIEPHQSIRVKASSLMRYVSRGGIKLEKALAQFGISVRGSVCLDVGASTGGFTDCLLQHGARRVYALDVGYGQLAWPLRQNARVIVIERTNIRHVSTDIIPETMDFITIDTSFISLRLVVPAALPFLSPTGQMVTLIKPQFEVGKENVGKGGVVRDPSLHQSVVERILSVCSEMGLHCEEVVESPILGPKGNKEFLLHLRRVT
jgi:23S rRNA (cytidine1920-2'-O)/16S rRNA (cytidine1409-2'-O)-methyltransferase